MVDVAVAAEQPRSTETVLEPMLLVEDGRMASVGVGYAATTGAAGTTTATGAIWILVDLVPDDRTARLSLVEAAPLEQARQWNVDLFVDLEIPSQNLDLFGALATALRSIQRLGQLYHDLNIVAGRSSGSRRRRRDTTTFDRVRWRIHTGRGTIGRRLLLMMMMLLLEGVEYSGAKTFWLAWMAATATTSTTGIVGRVAIAYCAFAILVIGWVVWIVARLLEGSFFLLTSRL